MSPDDEAGKKGPFEVGARDPAAVEAAAVEAAALALARARQAAREKGLRPGMMPVRRRRAGGLPSRAASGSGPDARDPALLGEQLDRLMSERGWQVDVAVGSVMGRWPHLVGPDVAAHVVPVAYDSGVLTVRADSTAWATQVRLLASVLLSRLEQEVGVGTVTQLKVTGPSAPSWSRGLRRVAGRGPRDTYG